MLRILYNAYFIITLNQMEDKNRIVFMLNSSSMVLFNVYSLSAVFYLSMLCLLLAFCIIFSLLGALAGKLLKLPGATLKGSFLVTLSYIGVYILINMAFILFPGTLRSSALLNLVNIVVIVFVMSYLYSRFFRSSYIEGLLIMLITIVLFIIVLLILYFVFIGILIFQS